jgi:hypothetical protein
VCSSPEFGGSTATASPGLCRRTAEVHERTAVTFDRSLPNSETAFDSSYPLSRLRSFRSLFLSNARLYPYWGSLTTALRTGLPQNEAKTGENFYEALYRDPAAVKNFLQAMTGISMGACLAVAKKLPWKKYKTFTDVGCAQGGLAVQLLLAHPHLSGTGFDLQVCHRFSKSTCARLGWNAARATKLAVSTTILSPKLT